MARIARSWPIKSSNGVMSAVQVKGRNDRSQRHASLSGGTSFTGTGSTTGQPGFTTVPGRTGAGGRTTGGSGVAISSTNFLAATYGNPLYPGRPGSTNISPLAGGGFGQSSFGATTTGGTARAATTTAGRTGATTGLGGRTGGTAGVSGLTPAGQIYPITFTTEVKFPVAPIRAPEVRAELQGLINRTSALRQPTNVRIEFDGAIVILRGRVADDDERRLVEGMVRMEPGVREVRNELTIP
jgi:hypothetical protein